MVEVHTWVQPRRDECEGEQRLRRNINSSVCVENTGKLHVYFLNTGAV